MTLENLASQGNKPNQVSMAAGISPRVREIRKDSIKESFFDFQDIEHRLERVANVHGIEFINDSKATNLSALAAGLRMAGGPVRLIAGGLLKEDDLDSVKKILVNRVSGVYIIGKYSRVMASAWQDSVPCVVCADLKEAVGRAWKEARSGDVILLSPGCASFDQFKSFEDRGEQFLNIVRDIEKGE